MRFQQRKFKLVLEKSLLIFILFSLITICFKLFAHKDVLAVPNKGQPIKSMHEFMKEGELTERKRSLYFEEDVFKSENVMEHPENNKIKRAVYLTFDDGPTKYTKELLGLLDAHHMKATFFMLEPNMKNYKSEVKELVDKGHSPALHGVTHDKKQIYQSAHTVINEMLQGQKTINELTGMITTLIRTPYGSYPYMNQEYKNAVQEAGFQLWDWTVDSEDWKYHDGEFVNTVINQMNAIGDRDKPIIILLHEKETTVKYLKNLLAYLEENHFETKTLTEQLSAYHF